MGNNERLDSLSISVCANLRWARGLRASLRNAVSPTCGGLETLTISVEVRQRSFSSRRQQVHDSHRSVAPTHPLPNEILAHRRQEANAEKQGRRLCQSRMAVNLFLILDQTNCRWTNVRNKKPVAGKEGMGKRAGVRRPEAETRVAVGFAFRVCS